MNLSLHQRSFFALAILLLGLLAAINLALYLFLPPYLHRRIEKDLERETLLARATFLAIPAAQLEATAHHLHNETGLRITVIAPDGKVIAESDKSPAELASLENHLNRPEVQDALRHGTGSARRPSDTLGVDMAYVAVNSARGVVRVALPLREIAATTGHIQRTIALASIVVALLAFPATYALTRRITGPISAMREFARNVARGRFQSSAPRQLTGELGELAAALHDMATQLADQLNELTREKSGLAAILAGMNEGVLVADAVGHVRLLNRALRERFDLTDDALGQSVLAVFRNIELDQLLRQPGTRELTFFSPSERVFAVNAAALAGHAGTVIVFHDITRLKQLENLRKDFVANVSHELRTPLSIIKGYLETLLEEPSPEPATARKFLVTAQKHTRQLEALVEDLLSISALESQQVHLRCEPLNLPELASTVADELAPQALAKEISLNLQLPPALPAVHADRQRLAQVLTNLLDNAIKYTQPTGKITLSARATATEIECCVADNGPGLAAEHLPRVFERFYRVDKARSRELGGTGLGLSIVKHIVQAHGGRVWAESVVGQGSQFYFTLPKPGAS